MTTREQIVEEILVEGLADWVPMYQLVWWAKQAALESGTSIKDVVTEVLETLLNEELIVTGNLGDEGFESWI